MTPWIVFHFYKTSTTWMTLTISAIRFQGFYLFYSTKFQTIEQKSGHELEVGDHHLIYISFIYDMISL